MYRKRNYNITSMKFSLNSKERKQINKILETRDINMNVAEMLMSFFDYDLSKIKPQSKEEFLSLFMEAMELDETNPENVEIVEDYIGKNFKILDKKIITENPYFKTIKTRGFKTGNYELTFDHYYPYQAFAYDDLELDGFKEISKIAYFEEKVDFPALSYKGNIWMNISPNEINTMQSSINEAGGDVLVLGLGLGYYAFMVSIKPNVKSVTIIENDKNIIDIFNKNLFEFFPNKSKIKIVKDDAFLFTKNNNQKYDYIFVDLWHNPEDGLPIYLNFKTIENQKSKYFYWLENGLKAMYNRCLLTVVEEQLNGIKESSYLKASNPIDEIINKIYFETKNVKIEKSDDLEKYRK